MRQWLFAGFIITAIPAVTQAAFELTPMGARPTGLAGAFVALADDANSPFINPAGMPLIRHAEFTSLYTRLYGLKELTRTMAAAVIPTPVGGVGFGYADLGGDRYRETTIGVSYGRPVIPSVLLGVTVRALLLSIQGYGSTRNTAVDAGGLIKLPGGIRMGFMLLDVNRTRIAGRTDGIPRTLHVGISRIGARITLAAQIDHDPGRPTAGRIGQEFHLTSSWALRSGIVTDPSMFFAGLGVSMPRIKASYALSSHPVLGLTHRVSLSVRLGRRAGK